MRHVFIAYGRFECAGTGKSTRGENAIKSDNNIKVILAQHMAAESSSPRYTLCSIFWDSPNFN